MKKLYTYIGRYWYGYLFAVFSMVTAIVLDMLYPKITQQIVDDVIIGGKLELFDETSGWNRDRGNRQEHFRLLQGVHVRRAGIQDRIGNAQGSVRPYPVAVHGIF